jgi:hypothetical protein
VLNQAFAAQFGVVGVSFRIVGSPNTNYDLLLRYSMSASGLFADATQVPQGRANEINAQFPGSGVGPILTMGLILPPVDGGDETFQDFTFWWFAGADLGFLQTPFVFQITPFSNNDPGAPNGTAGATQVESFPGGNPSFPSTPVGGNTLSGAGSGPGSPPGGTGRAAHNAVAVRGPGGPSNNRNILLAGGFNDGTSPNAFNTVDRFTFDTQNATHERAFSAQMLPTPGRRVLHASSFFIDPVTGSVRALTTGGVDDRDVTQATLALQVQGATGNATGTIYGFSPTEQVMPVTLNMLAPRFLHTATWVPCNEVVIIGGCSSTSTPQALASIEIYDPLINTFITQLNSSMQPAALTFARCGHQAALLPDGRVLVVGGFDPQNATTAVMSEIYDPTTGDSSVVTAVGSAMSRIDHTVTRLANGWILIVGGRSAITNNLIANAMVYRPETGDFVTMSLAEARRAHSATLLGNKDVLIAGGLTGQGTVEAFTTSAQVFRVEDIGGFTVTTARIEDLLSEPRAEHTATAVDDGTVFVIGGRNAVSSTAGLNFLDSIEFFSFSNVVPSITVAATSTSTAGTGTLSINVQVTDADQDGGYVLIRFTNLGSGVCAAATIVSQNPSSLGNNIPNLEVNTGSYSFVWDYAADGLVTGNQVEIEVIPVGAVIGSPVKFLAAIP